MTMSQGAESRSHNLFVSIIFLGVGLGLFIIASMLGKQDQHNDRLDSKTKELENKIRALEEENKNSKKLPIAPIEINNENKDNESNNIVNWYK